MEEGWNTSGEKRQAEIDSNTAKECSVTGKEGERFEEMFISFVPGYSLRTP